MSCGWRRNTSAKQTLMRQGHQKNELIVDDDISVRPDLTESYFCRRHPLYSHHIFACPMGKRRTADAAATHFPPYVCQRTYKNGAMEYTVVVVTEGNDPPGLAYIAPYSATSIAGDLNWPMRSFKNWCSGSPRSRNWIKRVERRLCKLLRKHLHRFNRKRTRFCARIDPVGWARSCAHANIE